MTQRWSSIVWCHWPVPIETVARRLPTGVRPDLFEGRAWVGLVPFEMQRLRLVIAGRELPAVPTTENFSEVNVRTYVIGPRGPGVWFDSLDASSRLGAAAARVAWSLPYQRSQIHTSAHDGPGCRAWSIRRPGGTTGRVRVAVGDAVDDRADLDAFLTERYALYARPWWSRSPASVLWAPVRHRPWEQRRCVDVDVDAGLVRAAGYPVDDDPVHVVAADAAVVQVGLPQRL
ncbi:DUF2071 domain-containing protein [Rhabdothermincola salaria]|uniref:DUF2071 domain-containing protein n=1 Tax=Rhabdothermincola salaria TaxID=2903142 RepID=UPI001E5F2B22|nr:DUF2071 domain-containing protein [Rhabdothermincola salaria]MCD9623657.1 DUF2071 domain-containing protein [Rhabdothermincola salaria]